ncbi:MAG: MOSC domain-containing protein [Bryobacteraceae bacterium]|nr:MOSC domain-containing protein [Bryobacteraceae bacterium]
MRGRIHQVSISRGGVPKLAVPESYAGPLGLEGDDQRNKKYHGGALQALLLVSLEDLEELRRAGFPVGPGTLGENLTVADVDFRQLRSGMRLRAGAAVIELTKLRQPCATLDVYNLADRRIQPLLYDTRAKQGDPSSPCWARGGFYAAVLEPGLIRQGSAIVLLEVTV